SGAHQDRRHSLDDPTRWRERHGPLNVAEQDDTIDIRLVFGVVQIGLVEDDVLAIAPKVALSIDVDVAVGIARGDESQVITKATGEGIAMAPEFRTWRQLREHCGLYGRDFPKHLASLGAGSKRTGMRRAVPFQIEPLPAVTKERVEADVVVLGRRLDPRGIAHGNRLVANCLPFGP